jgi:hypothetical protein
MEEKYNSMKAIVLLFWDICLFRRGPEQVPALSVLAVLVAAMYFLLNIATNFALFGLSFGRAVVGVTLEVLMLSTFVWLGLFFKGYVSRFSQTITAFLGQDVLISFMMLPLLMVANPDQASSALQVSSMLLFVLFGWSLSVKGFILQRALGLGPGLSFMLAFTMVVSTMLLVNRVMGWEQGAL